ncbi:thioredoxin, mitochondrial-like [Physella acuta]|nr:thioredoxin, mitochondrial-like [Physella acuta]
MSVRFASTSPKKFEVINVQDEEDFKKRVIDLSTDTPVVVDFHATWCGPCKLLGPRLESILAEGQGKVVMAKVDIDEISELAMAYGVKSVPTVVGIKNGKVLTQFIGLVDDDQIRTFVKKLVLS